MPIPIDDLLDEARELLDVDVAQAEAWASGLVAELDGRAELDELLAGLGERHEAAAAAVVAALVPMVPEARVVHERLAAAGVALPGWAAAVGTAGAERAWWVADPRGGRSLVVRFEHADGTRHDLLAELDGPLAVDLLVAPVGSIEAAGSEPGRPLEVTPLEPDTALSELRAALEATAREPGTVISDAYLLNRPLAAARTGLDPLAAWRRHDEPGEGSGSAASTRGHLGPGDAAATADHGRDRDADMAARRVLQAALGEQLGAPVPTTLVRRAAAELRAGWVAGDAEARQVVADAGLDDRLVRLADARGDKAPGGAGGDEARDHLVPTAVEVVVRAAGAYAAAGPRPSLSPAAAEAVDALEWADWLGAVIPLVHQGEGASAEPEQLVRNINRCGWVDTSIPTRDAPAVAAAFEQTLPAWRVVGAVDADLRLTALGTWLLPWSLAVAWGATVPRPPSSR